MTEKAIKSENGTPIPLKLIDGVSSISIRTKCFYDYLSNWKICVDEEGEYIEEVKKSFFTRKDKITKHRIEKYYFEITTRDCNYYRIHGKTCKEITKKRKEIIKIINDFKCSHYEIIADYKNNLV